MNRKRVLGILLVLACVGVALWYTPVKFFALVWLWVLLGIPRLISLNAPETEITNKAKAPEPSNTPGQPEKLMY